MTTLITLLISLLGYGTSADFSHMNETELNHEIEMAQADADGGTEGWDFPGVTSNPAP
ncbi:MAG: hypothetical protein ACJARP_002097 [Vicingaceae bacterium]|jgi:hypothetical protein